MEDNVPVILMDLPVTVKGFVCLGSDYNPCIVLNARLSREQQMKTYIHEMKHIRSGHMYDESYNEYGAGI